MRPQVTTLFIITALLAPAAFAAPPTVYEEAGLEIPPQAMDYDEENGLFVAHPGWIDGDLIHYYKFRMYVPPNYGTDDGGLDKVPVMPLYLPSTDGTLDGVPEGQRPVLPEYPEAHNLAYSDFVQIVFVDVDEMYAANADTDAASLLDGRAMTPSDIFANVPTAPMGSALQDPAKLDLPRSDPASHAPIEPWMAWYDGEDAQTFVFETTSQAFADYINPMTRPAAMPGYEASVVDGFMGDWGVSAIPIWHVNQYFTGVTPGLNNGGPSEMGQRNIIDRDRQDAGYSPLWQVFWATQLPLGYQADDARSDSDFQDAAGDAINGFEIARTPMFVNCPNIGPHGGTPVSDSGASRFGIDDVSGMDTVTIEGSLVMAGGVDVTLHHGDDVIRTDTTGMMGAYSFDVPVSTLDAGDNTLTVMDPDGNEVATYTLSNGEDAAGGSDAIVWIIVVAALIVLVYAYGRMKKPESEDREPSKPETAPPTAAATTAAAGGAAAATLTTADTIDDTADDTGSEE